MAKYEVVKPWFGVKEGDIIETDSLHPAIAPNVRRQGGRDKMEVATPEGATGQTEPPQRGRRGQ